MPLFSQRIAIGKRGRGRKKEGKSKVEEKIGREWGTDSSPTRCFDAPFVAYSNLEAGSSSHRGNKYTKTTTMWLQTSDLCQTPVYPMSCAVFFPLSPSVNKGAVRWHGTLLLCSAHDAPPSCVKLAISRRDFLEILDESI